MLRFGPADGPVVVMALPLFEEANRVRAFAVAILRELAELGVAGALPDLPGQGESVQPLPDLQLEDLRQAFAASVIRRSHVVALRSGALLTRNANSASTWLFAPVDGDAVIRELLRVRRMAQPNASDLLSEAWINGHPIEVGGHLLARAMVRDIGHAIPDRSTPSRMVRLASDSAHADYKLQGPPLWRRSEPGNDPVLVQALASDIADWVRACEGC